MNILNSIVVIFGLFVSSCAGDRHDIGGRTFSVVLNADHISQRELINVVKIPNILNSDYFKPDAKVEKAI